MENFCSLNNESGDWDGIFFRLSLSHPMLKKNTMAQKKSLSRFVLRGLRTVKTELLIESVSFLNFDENEQWR